MFMACPFFEVLYEGTRGPGKTDALLMDFGQHVGKGYGAEWRGILFRQTYKQLVDVINKTKKWFPLIWPDAKYNASEHHWTWPDGEQLLLRQFLRDDDYWNYHGHEYPWIGWEELCNWSSDVGYKRMMSCCRSTNPDLPRKYRATTNPYGPGHNWVKFRFRLPGSRNTPIIDAVDDDGLPEPPRIAIHGSIFENRILLDSDPDYLQRIRAAARNDAERRAWLLGDWDIVAGGMFDDVWRANVNVLDSFSIPDGWRIDRSFDWGSSRPFSVGWWAVSDGSDIVFPDGRRKATVKGDLFRIAEWYGWTGKPNEGLRMLASTIAQGIVEREVKWGIHGRVNAGPADPAIFKAENGNDISLDMAAQVRLANGQTYRGVQWIRANNARKPGWEKMRRMISNAHPPEHGPREYPGLYVLRRCGNFIRTVPILPRDNKDMDDVDTDAEDHIGDEARYRVHAVGQEVGSGRTTGMF
jgi:hypothetical protein